MVEEFNATYQNSKKEDKVVAMTMTMVWRQCEPELVVMELGWERERGGREGWRMLVFWSFGEKVSIFETWKNMCPKDKEQKECPFYSTKVLPTITNGDKKKEG